MHKKIAPIGATFVSDFYNCFRYLFIVLMNCENTMPGSSRSGSQRFTHSRETVPSYPAFFNPRKASLTGISP